MSDRPFFRNFSFALTSNVAGIGLTLLATLITIRSLDVTHWAVTAAIVTLGPLLSTAFSLGSATYHTRQLSLREPEQARAIYRRFMSHRLLWALILCAAGFITSAIIDNNYAALVALLAAARFTRTGATVFLQATRAFGVVALVTILDRATALTLVVLAAYSDLTVATLPLAQAAGSALAVVVALAVSHGPIAHSNDDRPKLLRTFLWMWQGSGSFGRTSLAGSLQQADVVLVGLVAGSTVGGEFAAAARVPGALGVVGSSLALVVLPAFSRGRISLQKDSRARLLSLAVAAGAGLTLLIATAGWWTPAILGEDYLPAVAAIRIYLLSVLLNLAYQPAIALLQSRGLSTPAAHIVTVQVALTLPLQAVAAHLWGASGAAIAYTAVLAAALLASGKLVHKRVLGAEQ